MGREKLMRPLNELMGSAENSKLLRKLVDCVAQAYADASDLHDPEVGSDARTYGMSVYTFVWHRIMESGLVRVTAKEPFWFEFGDSMVASHRVTGPTGAGINGSFPRDRSEWPTTVARQGTLDFEPQPGVTNNVLVLAHIGNESEGLLEVHLCRPLVDEHGHLASWAETAALWKRGVDETVLLDNATSGTEAKPQEENKPKPSVTLKKRKDKKDNGDASA
ncbi:hypothetical protein ATI61_106480 [Archangium gephyra]|uniref:Uncharacterized protein n=2 Tax=Archangium gephyra TaxID=48 RepID=A0ABX9K0Z4_9BACT|nr:hypothetical protein ATI61_106480 [Archangium gephyra]